jgi:pimeloyl-ACP methyl ester carboxylesterase
LRGHGSTSFLDTATPRSGQQAAIGVDVIALIDALKIPTAVLADYDWGGRAACVAAALWPERCTGLVWSMTISFKTSPTPGRRSRLNSKGGSGLNSISQRGGRAGLAANRNDITRLLWTNENPTWRYDDAAFQRSAASWENPDYVDVVIHSYRHRLGLARLSAICGCRGEARGAARYLGAHRHARRGGQFIIPATDGRPSAAKFSGRRIHHRVPNVGHALPQQAPKAFADAVMEVTKPI